MQISSGEEWRGMFSVVVPCYNSAATVPDCLQSLTSQEYQPTELVIVNDGSTDGTSVTLKELKRVYPAVKIVETEHKGASHARNVGFDSSKGEFILFADADAKYSSDYLTKAAIPFADPRVGGVCVTGSIWIKKSTFVSRGIALEYEIKQELLKSRRWNPYFAFVYRREALVRAGRFDEELFQSEDKDLFERVKAAGYRVELVDGFHWYHLYPQDIVSLISRSYRGGKQRVIYIFKKRLYWELFKRVVGLWVLVGLIGLSTVFAPAILAAGLLLGLIYVYRATRVMMIGGGKGRLTDALLLPFVSALRYLSGALGYTKGLLVYLVRRGRGIRTSWADV